MSDSYVPGSILRDVRAKISTMGASEYDTVDRFTSMQEMFNKLQDLREEMNQAKKDAAAKAAAPYVELMQQIESRYAFILKLKAGK